MNVRTENISTMETYWSQLLICTFKWTLNFDFILWFGFKLIAFRWCPCGLHSKWWPYVKNLIKILSNQLVSILSNEILFSHFFLAMHESAMRCAKSLSTQSLRITKIDIYLLMRTNTNITIFLCNLFIWFHFSNSLITRWGQMILQQCRFSKVTDYHRYPEKNKLFQWPFYSNRANSFTCLFVVFQSQNVILHFPNATIGFIGWTKNCHIMFGWNGKKIPIKPLNINYWLHNILSLFKEWKKNNEILKSQTHFEFIFIVLKPSALTHTR